MKIFLKEYSNKKEFKVWLINSSIRHWKAVIEGPENSVYENGKYQIDIKIPNEYPYKPPKM